jgi:nitrite reductase/ring-hydroxylating ferredoxin subunit
MINRIKNQIQRIRYSKNILTFLFTTILLFSVGSCYKEVQHETIPNVAVDIYIDVNSTLYLQLNNVGGWLYLTGGYKGILVYRVSETDFVAFDRTCPYDPYVPESRLEMDLGNLTVVDTVCHSKFVIIDGSVIEGPATLPMKQYRTEFDGTMLHIFN